MKDYTGKFGRNSTIINKLKTGEIYPYQPGMGFDSQFNCRTQGILLPAVSAVGA